MIKFKDAVQNRTGDVVMTITVQSGKKSENKSQSPYVKWRKNGSGYKCQKMGWYTYCVYEL